MITNQLLYQLSYAGMLQISFAVKSGHYYARFLLNGKEIWKSLKTARFPVTPGTARRAVVVECSPLMKIMRMAPEQPLVRQRLDFSRLNQKDIIGILHFAFDNQKGFLRDP